MVVVVESSADLDVRLHWTKHLAENGIHVPTVECLAKHTNCVCMSGQKA